MKLPHTKNSKAGANMYEPVVGSLFEAFLFPPGSGTTDYLLLSEHVRNVIGLFEDKIGDSTVTQKFQTATRTYDSNDKGDTSVTFTILLSMNLNDQNQNYIYNTMKDWGRKKFNPLTGERGLKRDYVGEVVVRKHDRLGNVYLVRTARQTFPSSNLPDIPSDYDSHEPQEIDVTFVADWVEEDTL